MTFNMPAYLFSGGRDYEDTYAPLVIVRGLKGLQQDHREQIKIVHGDCPDGLDATVDRLANSMKLLVVSYPANWPRYGRPAGPIRNRQMLDEEPDIKSLWAFHDDIENSSGTKDMCRQALKRDLPVYLTARLARNDPRLREHKRTR